MNEVATLAGTSLRFGSMTGLRDSEEELFEYMGKGCAFTESTGTLEDLKKAAELFLENGILCRLLSAYEWEIGSKFVSRSAPLLQPKSKWYLENCRLYLLLWWRNRAERTIPPILRRWMPEIFAAVCSE